MGLKKNISLFSPIHHPLCLGRYKRSICPFPTYRPPLMKKRIPRSKRKEHLSEPSNDIPFFGANLILTKVPV
jgi:hypothetical protein